MAASALLGLLDEAAVAFTRPPFWLLVSGLSLTAVELTSEPLNAFWLVSWLVGFLAAFGGGVSTALLMQSPSTVPLALFAKNEVWLAFTATWWAYTYLPGVRRLTALPPVRASAKVARSVLRANQVVQRVNAAAALFPGVVAAPIILGTLAGAGGKLITDAFAICAGYGLPGPSELAVPGHSLRSAALGAAAQYLLVHVAGWLTVQQGLGLVTSLYVAHSLATDLTGRPLDYTAPLGAAFHKLTLIPVPGAGAAAKRAAAKAASAGAGLGSTPAAKPARATRRRSSGGVSSPEHEAAAVALTNGGTVRRSTRARAVVA